MAFTEAGDMWSTLEILFVGDNWSILTILELCNDGKCIRFALTMCTEHPDRWFS
jgi:hypothetical protein